MGKIYKVVLKNTIMTKRHTSFYKTNLFYSLWDIIDDAIKHTKEKTKEKNNGVWIVYDIKRID